MTAAVALALTLRLADPQLGDEPPPLEGHPHLVLKQGEAAPSDGVFADELRARHDYAELHWLQIHREVCEEKLQESIGFTGGEVAYLTVITAVVGIVLGAVTAKKVIR